MTDEEAFAARFWPKVSIGQPNECWSWNGTRDQHGRGQIWRNGQHHRAPRVAWELHHKQPFPAGKVACHSCDNPNCVNPAHIWAGTQSDNIRDAVRKKRHAESRKTHCPSGHPLVMTNRGRRECPTCRAEWHRARARAEKAEAETEVARLIAERDEAKGWAQHYRCEAAEDAEALRVAEAEVARLRGLLRDVQTRIVGLREARGLHARIDAALATEDPKP